MKIELIDDELQQAGIEQVAGGYVHRHPYVMPPARQAVHCASARFKT